MRDLLLVSSVALFLVACTGEPPENQSKMSPTATTGVPLNNATSIAFERGVVLDGAFTISIPVRMDVRPQSRGVILSNWNLERETRGLELGVNGWQQLYLAVSSNGTARDGVTQMIVADEQLRLEQEVVVTIRFDLNGEMALFIGDEKVASAPVEIDELNPDSGDFIVGARPTLNGSRADFDGEIGEFFVVDKVLDVQSIGEVASRLGSAENPQPHVSVDKVTRGDGFTWFGYYDKFQTDPSDRYLLGMRTEFENRSPVADDVVTIVMIDLETFESIELGTSRAWNWQQGCMLQWRPGSDTEVLWNDREDDRFVTRIHDTSTGRTRTLPAPIYHVAIDGDVAVGLDFSRIQNMRAGYGYAGVPDPAADQLAPDSSTIYEVDLNTGEITDLVSLADIAEFPHEDDLSQRKHYFNHLQYSVDGQRFLFLHRWRKQRGGFGTRIFTSSRDGGAVSLLTDDRGLSHYAWRDDEHVLIWTAEFDGYALYRDGEGYVETVLRRPNGHQTYLPDRRWFVSDTYPGNDRTQRPFLYDTVRDEIFILGSFSVPDSYRGEWRVDNHPRVSRDGRRIFIDSAHEDGRQIYMLDVDEVLNWAE